jgi:hypothetical protein
MQSPRYNLSTRAGWWTFTAAIRDRVPFATSGALHGGLPNSTTGRLPADWRNLYQTGADYVVYSYGTPIAWHRPADDLWIVPDEKYSQTTSRHQGIIGTVISQLPIMPSHECDTTIRLSVPVKIAGAVTGHIEYAVCSACGKRRPLAAVNA